VSISSAFSKVSGGLRSFFKTLVNTIADTKIAAPAHIWTKPQGYGDTVTKILYKAPHH
jgi:hypothetical protein